MKITLPYLILATLLAGLTTYQVSRSLLSTLDQRFANQLADAAARSADEVVRREEIHLTALRAIAYTQGFSQALMVGDVAALQTLALPQAQNNSLAQLVVLDAQGQPLLALQSGADPSAYLPAAPQDYAAWQLVQQVLARQVDALGDKFSAIHTGSAGAVLYTAGPVLAGSDLVGVILVGSPVTALVTQLGRVSIADISLYDPSGQLVASTLVQQQPARLESSLIAALDAAAGSLPERTLALGPRTYVEVLDHLYLRGAPSGWRLGISLPESLTAETTGVTWLQLLAIFATGVLALIGLGVLVAQLIASPVFRLVNATQRVSQGDLDIQVGVFANDEIGDLTVGFNRMVGQLRQRESLRDIFGRMVSEEVREAVLQGQIEMGGETRDVTVLFTDLRGFTSMSEQVTPQEMIAVLNEFFQVIGTATKKFGGLINQFGGDSALVVFGAPIPRSQSDNLRAALLAAMDLRMGAAEMNARRILKGLTPLRFGVGINAGAVVAGNLGTTDRFAYTVIGDTVNVAARLQGLSRDYPQTPVLISSDSLDGFEASLGIDFLSLGSFELKGKSQPVPICTIDAPSRMQLPDFDRLSYTHAPRLNLLITAALYCKGIPIEVISRTLEVDPLQVREWLGLAYQAEKQVSVWLIELFGLTRAETNNLQFEPLQRALKSDVRHTALTY